MANNVSTYLQNARLNWMKGTTFPASPVTVYMALFTVQPTNAGTGGTEVTGGSYVRLAITSASAWSALSGATPTSISNSGAFTFVTATANWGTVVAAGLYDAVTSGNLLYVGALATNQVVNNGNTFSFAAGQFSIAED